jgi:hypothetical protein
MLVVVVVVMMFQEVQVVVAVQAAEEMAAARILLAHLVQQILAVALGVADTTHRQLQLVVQAL